MAYYTYYQRDYFTNSGCYPLAGVQYQNLLKCCFMYASYVSFLRMDSSNPFAIQLSKWEVQEDYTLSDLGYDTNSRCVYLACEELYHTMLSWCDDIFSSYTLGNHVYPEDPVFIRQDWTVFFAATIHEGECRLFPRNGEDVESVLTGGHWLYTDESGYPRVPAKEHQFPLPDLTCVQNDQLYKELLLIMSAPLQYLEESTIEAICAYIRNYRPPFLKNVKKLPPDISCLPNWYIAFEMYVLGECNALTFTEIPEALAQSGFAAEQGLDRFFDLLSQYIDLLHGEE